MDIQKLLAKAFDIGNTITFTVKKYVRQEHLETNVWSYTQLGIFLNTNQENILTIDIHLKENE